MTQNNDWEEEFDEKWLRMRNNGFGQHISINERMIWNVDPSDEDSWRYADETIKQFIQTLLDQTKQDTVKEVIGKATDSFAKGHTMFMFIDRLEKEYGIKDE